MRKNNCYLINQEMIRDLQSRWPCNGLANRVSFITFELDDGDLVDLDYFDNNWNILGADLIGDPDVHFINALIDETKQEAS